MVMLVLAGYGLYLVKWEVHELKRKNMMVQAEILQNQEAMNVLNTEWTYLNRPERLRELSEKYLTLLPSSGQQFADVAKLAEVPEVVTAEAETLVPVNSQVQMTSFTSPQ
jgi:hypothetical protein